MRLFQYLIVSLCALWALTPAACADGEVGTSPEEALRSEFPGQAPLVLDGPEAFVLTPWGEIQQRAPEDPAIADPATASRDDRLRDRGRDLLRDRERLRHRRSNLVLSLPLRGEDAVRFRLPDGFEVRVRELGAAGEGQIAAGSVAYPREGGTSYWTATAGGFEEWLLLEPGLARAGHVVAAWDVEGARVRQDGEVIEILGKDGEARLRVTSPLAFATGGREVRAALVARDESRIELTVDADGEAVLVDPAWTETAAMVFPRKSARATQLTTGDVLITGGYAPPEQFPTTAELFLSAAGVWIPAGIMNTGLESHTATLLPSGKVLVAGGVASNGNGSSVLTAATQLFNPASKLWTPGLPMGAKRAGHTATRLLDGRVLVTGGQAGNWVTTSSEIYDPVSATWKLAATMGTPRYGHVATLLANGDVLVTGGGQDFNFTFTDTAEIYIAASNKWEPAAPMSHNRSVHAALLLPNDKVLVVGKAFGSEEGVVAPGDAEIYDPAANTWTPTAGMVAGSGAVTLTLLPNGKVLLTGCCDEAGGTHAEVYSPLTDSWKATKPLHGMRVKRTATLLSSGKVLVACGGPEEAAPEPFAEIYDPGAVLGLPCGDDDDCESGFCADDVCCDAACDGGACDACSIKAGALEDGTCAPLTGTVCDDGDACTQEDACEAGVCAGAPRTCEASDACHEASACEASTGECGSSPKPDGTTCPGGVCKQGSCVPVTAPSPGTSSAGGTFGPPVPQPSACSCSVAGSTRSAQPFAALTVILGALCHRRRRRRLRAPARPSRSSSAR